jgi:ketosteroid isomerase-like protein
VEEASEIARRGIECWNARDLERMFADWDPDIVVRPDPYYPDSKLLIGEKAARRFWEEQRDTMGYGHLEVIEEHSLGERCLIRIRQHVEARASGLRSSYEWSYLTTVRAGKVVRIEFFLDRERGLAAAGLDGADPRA